MITNPVGNPKVAILASLVMGALTITVFMLRPGKGGLPVLAGFEHRDASPGSAADNPPAASLATGKIAVSAGNRSDASHVVVLDAVRASLQRNDLASAKVLLGAEQTLYKDDPRVIALQRELQAREQAENRAVDQAVSRARPVEHEVEFSATVHSSRRSKRIEHERGVLAAIRESAAVRASQSTQSRPAPEVETAGNTSVKPEPTSPFQTNPAAAVASPVPNQPAAEAPPAAQFAALPTPVVHALPVTPSAPTRIPAPTISTQAPKTRDEVRMEVERARANGDLPRFGNPDPAGPGGAPSRTTHAVVLDW